VAETALDDVLIDNITFPAVDGYLLGATLFLPRGARRGPDQFRHRRAAQDLQWSRIRARHSQRKVDVPQGVT
jgi:hypothetical protein